VDAVKAVLAAPDDYDRSMIATRARERCGQEAVAARWNAIYHELVAARRASRSDASR
jgi:hypothetical protein